MSESTIDPGGARGAPLYSGMTGPEIVRTNDVPRGALPLVTEALTRAVAARGRAFLVLAGGSTPLPLYHHLVGADLPWDRLTFLWGDERFVTPDMPGSNAGAAMRALLDHVPVPEANIHPWPILSTPTASAAAYRGVVEGLLGPEPVFDVTLLGLGADGHTASLFPGTGDALREEMTLATTAPATASVRDRLTFGATALSRSRLVLFLVRGADKLPALTATFGRHAPSVAPGRPLTPAAARELDEHPARAVGALERLLVVTDQEVA